MPLTQSSSNKQSKVFHISQTASSCIKKGFTDQIWCNNCRDAINLGWRENRKSCEQPWKYKIENNNARERLFAIKIHNYFNDTKINSTKKRLRTISHPYITIFK